MEMDRADRIAGILAELQPDVLGLSEIGGLESLRDLQTRLRDRGVDLPAKVIVESPDQARRLGLLSRFPVVSDDSQPLAAYEMEGRRQHMRRGILDVTLQIDDEVTLRCIGLHLKSKRPVPKEQELIRRLEAYQTRQHLNAIFETDPDVLLLLHGDLNALRNEVPIREIIGPRGDPGQLKVVDLADSLGDRWTHYWKTADLYSRIDYIMLSRALAPHLASDPGFVHRMPEFDTLSDHRPLVLYLENLSPTSNE